MGYVIFTKHGLDTERYMVTPNIWTTSPDIATPYTLHGARSMLGKLAKVWNERMVAGSRRPDEWGYIAINKGEE